MASVEGSGTPPHAAVHRFAVDTAGHRFEINRDEYSGTRLLIADARVLQLLLRDVRYRSIERVFGVPREHSNIVALIALGLFVRGANARARRVLTGPGGPSRVDAFLGLAAAREALYDVAGPGVKELPLGGALLTVAIVARLLSPFVGKSVRGARTSSQRLTHGFEHRYGHLIGRSHRAKDRVVSPSGT